jgi:hypothetical protein
MSKFHFINNNSLKVKVFLPLNLYFCKEVKRGINSLAGIPRTPSSQGKIGNDIITLPDLEINSLISQSQSVTITQQELQEAINIVESNLNQISLEAKGIKRSQDDLASPYLNDNEHLNKKVLNEKYPDNEEFINTEN